MKKVAYLGMDVHSKNCVLGHLDASGNFLGNVSFQTSERNIVDALKAVKAKKNVLYREALRLTPLQNRTAPPKSQMGFASRQVHGLKGTALQPKSDGGG